MNIKITGLIFFTPFFSGINSSRAQNKVPSQTGIVNSEKEHRYHLVWADEFNKDGPPDSTCRSFEKGFVRNQELQWYQQENAWCENGLLIIEGRKESKPHPGYTPGSNDSFKISYLADGLGRKFNRALHG